MEGTTSPDLTPEQIQHFIPFDELSVGAITELLPHFRFYRVDAKKVLFKRGEEDSECHFLLTGSVDLADDQFRITPIRGDDDENFLALDASHSIHRHAAISQTPCTLFAVKRQHLELITTWSELTQSWQQDDDNADWLETLLTSGLFNRIPPGNIQKLLSRFIERPVALGEQIIREGEEGHECYVIKQGKALVTRQHNNKTETLVALSNGVLLGEHALISNLPRNASSTMSSYRLLMVVSKEEFDALLKQPVLSYGSEDELDSQTAVCDTGNVVLDVQL